MDELEFYQNSIQEIAKLKEWSMEELGLFLNEKLDMDKELMDKIISIRKELLTEEDQNSWYLYFKDNYFRGENLVQLTLSSILQEILKLSKEYYRYVSFEKYHENQPLFQNYPELIEELRLKPSGNKDYELIKLNAVDFNPAPNLPKLRMCKYKNSFLLTNRYLDSRIPFYLIQKYGKDNIYIRIEPYMVYDTPPAMNLEEEFLRPPNPKWIERLKIYSGKSEGCEIFLPDLGVEDIEADEKKKRQYWEYSIKKIRRLETNATMKNEGNQKHFSMSLEELSEESLSEGILVGRMIHLDAIDSYDVPFNEIRLNHLDLAINIYKNEKIGERMGSSLASGGVITDASYRTHLIRVDNIMFSDLLEIARLFFYSETMVEEWIDKQFGFMKL